MRGRATNPAKLSRTTPAELFSESSRGVVRERLLIASPSFSFSLLSGRGSRCEIEGIEENSSVGRTGNRRSRSFRGSRRKLPSIFLSTCPAQSHFHRRRSVYTRCRTRPTNIFLAEFFLAGSCDDNALPPGLTGSRTEHGAF